MLICGCGRTSTADDGDVRTYWNELNGFTAHVKILSNLEKDVLEYEVHYVYNKEDSDQFVITAPESLAGISGTIAGKDSGAFTLQYDNTKLDDAMPQRSGLTPADALFGLLCDLRDDAPTQQWTEEVKGQKLLVLRYDSEDEQGAVGKQIWLTADGKQPVCAELYADKVCVLTLQFTSYQST